MRTNYSNPKRIVNFLNYPNTRSIIRCCLNRILKAETDIYTYDDLNFKPHPRRHMIKGLEKQCLVYFINGRGLSIIKTSSKEFPYEAIAYNRHGYEIYRELLDDICSNFGIRFKTKEELSEFMIEVQELPRLRQAERLDIKMDVVLNFLETYSSIKRKD